MLAPSHSTSSRTLYFLSTRINQPFNVLPQEKRTIYTFCYISMKQFRLTINRATIRFWRVRQCDRHWIVNSWRSHRPIFVLTGPFSSRKRENLLCYKMQRFDRWEQWAGNKRPWRCMLCYAVECTPPLL